MQKSQLFTLFFHKKIKEICSSVKLFLYDKGRNVFMKKKGLKYLIIALGIAVVAILLLVVLPQTLEVNTNTLFQSAISLLVWIVVITLIVNIIMSTYYYIKIKKQLELLNEGKTHEAIDSMKKLLLSLHNPRYKRLENICKINISSAYCDLNEYGKGQEVLDSVDTASLSNNTRFIYEFNQCVLLYYLGNTEKFIENYDKNKEAFDSYKTYKNYEDNIEMLEIFYELSKKNYETAEEKFSILSNKNLNSRLRNDVRNLRDTFKEIKSKKI